MDKGGGVQKSKIFADVINGSSLKGCDAEELFARPPFVIGEAERKINRILHHSLTDKHGMHG